MGGLHAVGISRWAQAAGAAAEQNNDYRALAWIRREMGDWSDPARVAELNNEIIGLLKQAGLSNDKIREAMKEDSRAYLHRRRVQLSDDNRTTHITISADMLDSLAMRTHSRKEQAAPDSADYHSLQQLEGQFLSVQQRLRELFQHYLQQLTPMEPGEKSDQPSAAAANKPATPSSVIAPEPKRLRVAILYSSALDQCDILYGLLTKIGIDAVRIKIEPNIPLSQFSKAVADCSFGYMIVSPGDLCSQSCGGHVPHLSFSLGWFAGVHGWERVCLLMKEHEGMRLFQSFLGIPQKRFYERVDELERDVRLELASLK